MGNAARRGPQNGKLKWDNVSGGETLDRRRIEYRLSGTLGQMPVWTPTPPIPH